MKTTITIIHEDKGGVLDALSHIRQQISEDYTSIIGSYRLPIMPDDYLPAPCVAKAADRLAEAPGPYDPSAYPPLSPGPYAPAAYPPTPTAQCQGQVTFRDTQVVEYTLETVEQSA